MAKLNVTGTSLVYSTYLGGSGPDNCYAIAVDSSGNTYIAGGTSASFPATKDAFQTSLRGRADTFIAKIRLELPRIISAEIEGKRLIVSGENFDNGAVIFLNGEQQKTKNDDQYPDTKLIARKAGKKIARGQTASIQVRNVDGTLSNEFRFARPNE